MIVCDLVEKTLGELYEYDDLKENIRECLKKALNSNQFKPDDQKELTDIMIKYFC